VEEMEGSGRIFLASEESFWSRAWWCFVIPFAFLDPLFVLSAASGNWPWWVASTQFLVEVGQWERAGPKGGGWEKISDWVMCWFPWFPGLWAPVLQAIAPVGGPAPALSLGTCKHSLWNGFPGVPHHSFLITFILPTPL
jgi:hypothetical protein